MKKTNQETLFENITDAIKSEIRNMTSDEYAHFVANNRNVALGLICGMDNITLRELADVFTFFGKVISIELVKV